MKDKFLTTFFKSVRNGDVVAVRAALMEGADPNARDSYNLTPLMWAARRERIDIAKELLKAGGKSHLTDSIGRNFLHHSVLFRKHGFVKYALGIPEIPLNATEKHGFTAIDLAIADRNERIVDLLRDAGATPNHYK